MEIRKVTEKYTKEIRQFVANLLIEKKPASSSRRYCFHLHNKTLCFIEINKSANKLEIMTAESRHYDTIESLPSLISYFAPDKNLNIPTYWLLTPDDYQLFLIDSLPVEAGEIQEALQWRVRSLINYPIEEAIVDYFKLPTKRNSTEHMVAVVVARKSYISTMSSLFKQGGHQLATIDVPELAMRNLTALYEDDEKSTAFIYFFPGAALLNITREKTLYFTRKIKLSSPNEPSPQDYQQLSLEITRYFDYYQSQWRHPPPNRIFVSAENLNITNIVARLSDYLHSAVEPYKIKSVRVDEALCIENENLLALGCAMREETANVKTRN